MAKTSLRSYNHEIEILIDRGQIDEAIAHCRHILKYFPKHVDTYRLLGKAYLESQRYSDAADILQRVLSSVPEDFVSHVGMSMIREDETNLDEAIWHMERAYEMQPANPVIQDELRRLFARREGLEPRQLRLTRGALARMYLRGDLHQQAIAEVRAALSEDPKRLDLQALLARAFFQAGQRVDAVETASKILKSLPYCLEANSILAHALSNTERAEDARVYKQRLSALDPYQAYLGSDAPTLESVPDSSVMIEKLDYHAGQSAGLTSQPEWAASLGVEVEGITAEKEALPDWLTDAPESETGPAKAWDRPETQAEPVEAEASPAEEADIPAWLKDSGWEVSTQPQEAPPPALIFDEQETEEEAQQDLAPAEIPDWLQSIAPEEQKEELFSEPEAEALETPEWLRQAQTEPEASLEETSPAEANQDTASILPDWLQSSGSALEQSEELPDWLSALDSAGPLATGHEVAEPEDALPSWLSESQPSTEEEPPEEAITKAELPDWLAEAQPMETSEAEPEELPSAPALMEEQADEIQEQDSGFAWLESLAAKQGAEEALLLSPDERQDQPPDWVLSQEETDLVEPTEPAVESMAAATDWQTEALDAPEAPELEEAASTAATIPSWLSGIEQEAQPGPAEEAPEAPAASLHIEEPLLEGDTKPVRVRPSAEPVAEEVPEWLRPTAATPPTESEPAQEVSSFTEKMEESEPELAEAELPAWLTEVTDETRVETPVQEADLPEWLKATASETDEELSYQEASLPVEAMESEAVAPEGEDDDAAFAWLESLAVKQGAEEALLLTPEERQDQPPDWVQEAVETEEAENEQEAASPTSEMPDWLKQLTEDPLVSEEPSFAPDRDEVSAAEISLAQEEIPAVAEETLAEALSEAEVEPEMSTPVLDEEAPIEPERESDSYSETFVEHEAPAVAQPEAAAVPDLPDWLTEPEPETEEEVWSPPALQPVDLNLASMVELERLPGVGFILAQAIITYRDQNGPFRSLTDLEKIGDLSPEQIEDLEPYLSLPAQPVFEEEETPVSEPALSIPVDSSSPLYAARSALASGNSQVAAEQYSQLVKNRQNLAELILDLEEAVQKFPQEVNLWQTLGDSLMRADRFQEALDAYTQAEKLLG